MTALKETVHPGLFCLRREAGWMQPHCDMARLTCLETLEQIFLLYFQVKHAEN